jgi:epoxyqueuosine reductase
MIPDKMKLTTLIKQKANEIGFAACGVAKAGYLEKEAPLFENWLKNGMHGKMQYMENHFDKRLNPQKLMPGAKSVIVFLFNYFPEKTLPEKDNFIISKYAYGKDYHFVIKEKLRTIIDFIAANAGEINARPFVDSAPVLERAWAGHAGLGWTGKNAHLIMPKAGSFFFLSEIITDLELDYDPPRNTNLCGACRNCIDACPTKAIIAPGVIDASRCISYLTIELRDEIPDEFKNQMSDRIFGCDICQDVCPWNRFSKPHFEQQFLHHTEVETMDKKQWQELSKEKFNRLFKNSAINRARYKGLVKNIRFISGLGESSFSIRPQG